MHGCMGSFMALKREKPHLKVVLSIGGASGSEHFATVAASAACRDNFGRSAKGLITAAGFDGIDSTLDFRDILFTLYSLTRADTLSTVDWEHPSDAQQGRDFLSLLATVRLHLPEDEYLLTTALPVGQWVLRHIDLYKAQEYLDLLNLMAYDFNGPWTPKTGYHAQLYAGGPDEHSGAAGVSYVISTGFPAKKILLGIPVYGRSFLGATGPGQEYNGHGGDNSAIEYKNLPSTGTDEIVDTPRVAAFCSGGDGGFVSYDNQETVKLKAAFCKAQGLAVSFKHFHFVVFRADV